MAETFTIGAKVQLVRATLKAGSGSDGHIDAGTEGTIVKIDGSLLSVTFPGDHTLKREQTCFKLVSKTSMRSRSRSAPRTASTPSAPVQSPSRTATPEGSKPRAATNVAPKSFQEWMRKNLEDQPTDKQAWDKMAWNKWRAAYLQQFKFMDEILAGNDIPEPSATDPKSWALSEARNECKRHPDKVREAVDKFKKSREEDAERKRKKKESEQATSSKKHNMGKKEDTPMASTSIPELRPKQPQEYSNAAMPGTASKSSDHTLMKVATSTLATNQVVDVSFEFKSDDTPQDMLKKTEAREEHLEHQEEEMDAKIVALKAEKTSLTDKRASLTKKIGFYSGDKDFKFKVKQLRQERDEVDTRLVTIGVELEQSQKCLKDLSAQFKEVEQKKRKLKTLVDREAAETALRGDADAQNMTCVDESGPIENKATEIFQALDRCESGTVTRRDFYKGMANADVAAFLKLPHGKVQQEGDTRTQVEHAFQEIAGDSDEFDLETFLSKYGSK